MTWLIESYPEKHVMMLKAASGNFFVFSGAERWPHSQLNLDDFTNFEKNSQSSKKNQ